MPSASRRRPSARSSPRGRPSTSKSGWALEARPWFADAVRIRRWDDEAKIVGAVCPPLAAYRPLIERWLGPQSWPAAAGIA